MKLEEGVKYKVDLVQTFFANIFWMLQIIVVIGFAFLLSSQLENLETDTNRLLGLIIICFTIVKLMSWIKGPHIHYKEKNLVDG